MVIIFRIAPTVPPLPAPPLINPLLRGASPPSIIPAMARANEVQSIFPWLCQWTAFDPAVKAELFSTAITTGASTYLIDPIPLTADALSELIAGKMVAGIVITNENHERAAADFAREFQAPIYSAGTKPFPGDLAAIEIEGAPKGEIAIFSDADGGTIIMGDALINFEPYGFALLPAKYCSDAKQMRSSLLKLLDYSFKRMLFAHGMPILSCARRRLEQLLESG